LFQKPVSIDELVAGARCKAIVYLKYIFYGRGAPSVRFDVKQVCVIPSENKQCARISIDDDPELREAAARMMGARTSAPAAADEEEEEEEAEAQPEDEEEEEVVEKPKKKLRRSKKNIFDDEAEEV
jgi:hypothetical protein